MEQGAAELIHVTILTGAGGDSLTLELPSSTLLAELKTIITEKTSIEYQEQRLLAGVSLPEDTATIGSLAECGAANFTLICALEPEVLDILNSLRSCQGLDLFHACLGVAKRFYSGGMSDHIVERRRNVAVQLEFHKAIIGVLKDLDGHSSSALQSEQRHLCAALGDICSAVPHDDCECSAETRRQAIADAGGIEVIANILASSKDQFDKEQASKALSQICRAHPDLGNEGLLAVEGRRQHCVDVGALSALVAFLKGPLTSAVRNVALSALRIIVAGDEKRVAAAVSAGVNRSLCLR